MNKDVANSLGWGAAILALGLIAGFMRSQGWIGEEATTRIVMGATGLMVAAFGNRMPKTMLSDECARRAARVGGWSLALSGLVYAILWAFAPVKLAPYWGCAAVLLGMAITVGYTLSLRNRASAGPAG